MLRDLKKIASPRTTNEILIDRGIRHAIYLSRLSGGEAKWVRDQVPELRREITKAIAPVLAEMEGGDVMSLTDMRLLEEASNKTAMAAEGFFEELRAQHIEHLVEIGIAEADFEHRLFQQAIPIEFNYNTPSDTLIRSLMGNEPLSGKTVNQWFREMPANTRTAVNEQIREGMIEGESINEILRRVRGTRENGFTDGIIARQGRYAENVVRAGVMAASDTARAEFHKANEDLISGYKVSITLDTRTCLLCIGMEAGNPYPVTERPRAPFHLGICRCVVTAIVKSNKELGAIEGTEEWKTGTRASMDGEVPADMTYAQWFETQSEKMKEDILGPSRYAAYKKGMEVTAFADRGQILTLDELQYLE